MADVFKFTGKNGGDPGEYWRAITIAAQVTIEDALKGGKFLREHVTSLTARGVDYTGSPFAPYTSDYARRTGKSLVNLRVSGRMLSAVKTSVNGKPYSNSSMGSLDEARTMGVGIYDNDKQAMKGNVHNEGLLSRSGSRGRQGRLGLRGGVRRIPKRRWLDATRQTVQNVNQVMVDSMGARVSKAI